MNLDANDFFAPRHIGPRPEERDAMLRAIGVASLDALIDEALPASIRRRSRSICRRRRASSSI